MKSTDLRNKPVFLYYTGDGLKAAWLHYCGYMDEYYVSIHR